MTNETSIIDALLPIWVRGWALARGTKPPVPLADGVQKVEVGKPDELVRYVVPDNKLDAVARLARELRTPASWLKICAEREQVAPLLPPHWQLSDQRYFMSIALQATPPMPLPAGYSLALTEAGPLTKANISAADGTMACSGNLLLLGCHAVFDQIGTEAEHRRKGLGQIVMQALAERALARQATTGLLVATEEGRHLYLTLDWQTLSPYTSAFIAAKPGMP